MQNLTILVSAFPGISYCGRQNLKWVMYTVSEKIIIATCWSKIANLNLPSSVWRPVGNEPVGILPRSMEPCRKLEPLGYRI